MLIGDCGIQKSLRSDFWLQDATVRVGDSPSVNPKTFNTFHIHSPVPDSFIYIYVYVYTRTSYFLKNHTPKRG